MKWAFENGADFILQMDQDSIPHDDLVEKLLECYEELTEKGYKVGLVGSQDYDKDTKYLSKAKIDRGTTIESECYIKINQVISSGSLIPIETYKIIGGMDDDLFIDAVDFEYCWRALSKGFIVVKNLESIIGHKLGNGISSFFNLKYISPSPIRHYYQFRNFILLSKRNYVPFYWKISTFIKYLLSLIFLPFLFQQRVKRFKYMINGIYDGILGKKGSINNAK
jgi:rhamnosyltransferase